MRRTVAHGEKKGKSNEAVKEQRKRKGKKKRKRSQRKKRGKNEKELERIIKGISFGFLRFQTHRNSYQNQTNSVRFSFSSVRLCFFRSTVPRIHL